LSTPSSLSSHSKLQSTAHFQLHVSPLNYIHNWLSNTVV